MFGLSKLAGGNTGIDFVVPINVARGVREPIVQNGRGQRGRIGVSAQDLPAGVAKSTGRNEGAVICRSHPFLWNHPAVSSSALSGRSSNPGDAAEYWSVRFCGR